MKCYSYDQYLLLGTSWMVKRVFFFLVGPNCFFHPFFLSKIINFLCCMVISVQEDYAKAFVEMADKRFSKKIKTITSKTQFMDFGLYKVKHVL